MMHDIARLHKLERELEQMRQKVGRMVPERPDPFDPTQMALGYLAQAANGCQGAGGECEDPLTPQRGLCPAGGYGRQCRTVADSHPHCLAGL